MNRDEFDRLLLRHGPQMTRWPQAERVRAEALLATDPGARAAHAELAALEAAAARAVRLPPDAGLAARIAAAAGPERAAFAITPGRLFAALATSLGLAGAGYAAASLAAGLIAPTGYATGLAGIYGVL
ncbi:MULTISPECIES: hypothetical protein [unclassified Roseitalea]|uniref:hypothetical protein n=1 Tax=unclassified Roseitalea TaxID=2639107 RepID=UPI00273E4831|nr:MULTISPECIES: hypothetical protein [unclassified Roseitalea]